MTSQSLQKVDHAAIKANQITIILLNVLAFVFNLPILAAFVAIVMGMGAYLNVPGFSMLYHRFYKPFGLLKADILEDNPEPHRFAQFLGFIFMSVGSLGLFLGVEILGWGLIWLVAALAALNAFGGFCVGCAAYYWLGILKVPGFVKSAPDGIMPGMKPRVR